MVRSDAAELAVRRLGADTFEEDPDLGLPPTEIGTKDLDLLVVSEFGRPERFRTATHTQLALASDAEVAHPLSLTTRRHQIPVCLDREQVDRCRSPLSARASTDAGARRGSRSVDARGGEWRATPVNLLTVETDRYLVAPRGETQWVRNLRVAGEGELRVGRRTEAFRAAESLTTRRSRSFVPISVGGRPRSGSSSKVSAQSLRTASSAASLRTIRFSASRRESHRDLDPGSHRARFWNRRFWFRARAGLPGAISVLAMPVSPSGVTAGSRRTDVA